MLNNYLLDNNVFLYLYGFKFKGLLMDNGKIICVCFMDMFTKANWLNKVNFDCVIGGTLINVVKK